MKKKQSNNRIDDGEEKLKIIFDVYQKKNLIETTAILVDNCQ